MINIGVLVSGRGSNLQAIIDAIEKGQIKGKIAIVISNNPDAQALKRAQKFQIPTQILPAKNNQSRQEYDKSVLQYLKRNQVALVVLAGYMRLLSPYFIQHYRYRIINIHPALLPSFPGLNAQRQALKYGVKVSGCTVHFVDEGVDTGPIILQKTVKVKQDDDEDRLSKRILKYEHQALTEAIKLFVDGKIEIRDKRVWILN